MATSDLAVITTYFNPYGFASRRRNYNVFMEAMRGHEVEVYTAAVACGEEPLALPDGLRVVQLRSRDVLWHKERAINALVPKLPAHISKVAWADCDILPLEKGWESDLSALLERYPVCQGFTSCQYIPGADGRPPDPPMPSSLQARAHGSLAGSAPGFLWAARREVLEQCPLFDELPTGGGALAFLYAVIFPPSQPLYWSRALLEHGLFAAMSDTLSARYIAWVRRLSPLLKAGVACLPQHIQLLPHADAPAHYRRRFASLSDLDPERDLRSNDDGLWEWRDADGRQARQVREFFLAREEDE